MLLFHTLFDIYAPGVREVCDSMTLPSPFIFLTNRTPSGNVPRLHVGP
jgi:hypothetical protein